MMHFCFDVLGIIIIGLVIGIGVLAWRIHARPLDVSFARDYVEKQLYDPKTGFRVSMENVSLHWPVFNGPVHLWADKVVILDEKTPVMSMAQVAFGLSRSKLILGQVAPVSLVITQPEISIQKDLNGDWDIGFGDIFKTGPVELEGDQTLLKHIVDFLSETDNERSSNPLITLKKFEVRQAMVSFYDLSSEVTHIFEKVDFNLSRNEEGIDAQLLLPLEQKGYLGAMMSLPFQGNLIPATMKFENVTTGLLAKYIPSMKDFENQQGSFDVQVQGSLDGNFMPQEMKIAANSREGVVVVPQHYPNGLAYKNFILSAVYNREKKTFFIEDGAITLNNVPIQLKADFAVMEDEITGPLQATIATLDESQIGPVWPQSQKDSDAYEWAVEKVTGAHFSNVFVSATFRALKNEEGWNTKVESLKTGFTFENASVDYRNPLPPVKEGKGRAVFDLEKDLMVMDIESGKILDLNASEAKLVFNELVAKGKGDANISLKLKGPLSSVLQYVSHEPLGFAHDFDLMKVKGDTALDIKMVFPTTGVSIDTIKFDISGTATDVTLPGVVKNLPLTGGPFDVMIKGNEFIAKGKGKLDGRDIKAEYRQFLKSAGQNYESKITAELTADETLRSHFGIDLSDFLQGPVPVSVIYTDFTDGHAEAAVNTDLTAAHLAIEPFRYEKAAGLTASASLTAVFANKNLTSIKNFRADASGMTFAGGNLKFKDEKLSSGTISNFILGENKGALEFDLSPTGLQQISLKGEFLDLTPFLDDEKKEEIYAEPPRQISIDMKSVRTTQDRTIQNAKFYLDIDKMGNFNQMEMDAVVGQGAAFIRFKPDASGKRTFRLEAADAGAFLRAFGLYDKIRGGKLEIQGDPIRGIRDRNLTGTATITNFRVVKAPALAKLLGAMSLPGVLDLLNNDGIAFEKLESDFNWLFRQQGSLLILKNGRTSGSSVGFTFDGTFDNSQSTMNVEGTIVPLSGINKMLSDIPLVGDILSGGTNSIFAATYTIKGKSEDPDVMVNPLAVLTPGLIRRILFE